MNVKPSFKTRMGKVYQSRIEDFLDSKEGKELKGCVQLILTSPPFPLNNKKRYGNYSGEKYKEWLISLAKPLSDLLTDDGSIVIELGNAWESGRPVQSLLHLESLIGFVQQPDADLRLCQQFICYNPARLPSPAQWVTIKRIRLTDSYTHVWWMAKSDYPKADNRKVLRPYSKSMKRLLKRRAYNAGKRPSEFVISEDGFLTDHGGSIPHNMFELEGIEEGKTPRLPNVMRFANTSSNDYYLRTCRERGITPHPARMPLNLAAFFINFLTDPGDLVFDPFAGTNTTGYVAELDHRRWVAVETDKNYIEQARIRFDDPAILNQNNQKGKE